MNDDTEKQLLEYLREQRVADVAGTMRTIANWTTTHEAKDDVRHEEIKGALRGHSLRITALEKNDDRIDDRLERSGSWQIESEQAKAIVAAKEATWWKDKAITVLVGVVMLGLGGVVSFLFARK